MLEDFYLPMRLAVWNRARSVWETGQMQFLCEHSVPFLATWPTSGMTRNGQAFELPTPELHTGDSECSLLPTAGVAGGGKQIPEDAIWSGKAAYKPDGTKVQVHLDRIEMLLKPPTPLMPTPRTSDTNGACAHGTGGPDLRTVVSLLPTATARDWRSAGHLESHLERAEKHAQPLSEILHLLTGATTNPRSDGGKP